MYINLTLDGSQSEIRTLLAYTAKYLITITTNRIDAIYWSCHTPCTINHPELVIFTRALLERDGS